ncbi:MAG: DUF547 domain-containing protein [Reichenbachiella sp.]
MRIGIIITLLIAPFLANCSSLNPQTAGSKPPSHAIFDNLLKDNVDNNGLVNYKGIKAGETTLDEYLRIISENGPNDKNWKEEEKLTYWINAYNAFTIKLILKYYPLKSIKDIGSAIQIPFVNTAWDIKFIKIGGEELSLNNIEHSIIRKNFEEPRIHFALVCAAKSCPKLRNEAYSSTDLDNQLTDQARSFLSNSSKNQITNSKMKLSKLFSWYGADFTKNGSLIEYLNQYAPVKIDKKADKSFMSYDWSLNEQ